MNLDQIRDYAEVLTLIFAIWSWLASRRDKRALAAKEDLEYKFQEIRDELKYMRDIIVDLQKEMSAVIVQIDDWKMFRAKSNYESNKTGL